MRSVNLVRIIMLVALLAVTAFIVHGRLDKDRAPLAGRTPLGEVLAGVEDWKSDSDRVLNDQVVNALMLDDYIFRRYGKGSEHVDLYIGYYMTAKKVGAAHAPLVCFNGQGWRVEGQAEGKYTLHGIPEHVLSYSMMTAERGGDREMVVYWFQANGSSFATTLGQKIHMVSDRLRDFGGRNAFVRISTQMDGGKPEEAKKRIFAFIESFYPRFHRYMTSN